MKYEKKMRSEAAYICQRQSFRRNLNLKSDPEFESGFPDWFDLAQIRLSARPPDRSQNVGVSEFAKIYNIAIGGCMWNVNKSPKTPYSTMVREVEK